jgi:glycosyltransferase involved in cell wall biosynthesis
MKKIKVSVVMPSLNVAAYIEQCIISVRNQSLQNIEIICVDAGSTDGTWEILEKHAALDDRIRLLKSTKKSYGYQMNLGIAIAQGEYIGIVETDDAVEPTMYETLYEVARSNELDYIKADFVQFGYGVEKPVHLKYLQEYYNRLLTEKDRRAMFSFWTSNWAGIYQKKYLLEHNILFHETPGAAYQDNGFLVQVMAFAKRCMYIDKTLYRYRLDNPNSSVKSKDKMKTFMEEFDYIEEILLRSADEEAYCLSNYYRIWGHRFTVKRLDRSQIKAYVPIMDADYKKYKNQITLPILPTGENAVEWVQEICDDPEKKILEWQENYEKLRNTFSHEGIYVYGVGEYAARLCRWFIENDMSLMANVCGFIVSSKKNVKKIKFFDRDVMELNDLDLPEKHLIVIAVKQGSRIYREIEEKLEERGINNYCNVQFFFEHIFD